MLLYIAIVAIMWSCKRTWYFIP